MSKTIRIGVIGMGWMGNVHARAYRSLIERFNDTDLSIVLAVCADDVEQRAQQAQAQLGFTRSTTDWKQVVNDPEIDAVVVTTPNNTHLDIIQAAAANGKHIFCEKPVGCNPQETAAAYRASQANPIVTSVGYNYRWAPLVQYARQLIADGKLGQITHYRGRFLVDYGSDPRGVLSWRFQRDVAGSGTLGDLMSHVIDMGHMLVGPISHVVSNHHQFIRERPLSTPGQGTHFSVGSDGPKGKVTNEDYVSALAAFANGAQATVEVSRVVKGHDCEMAFEVNGTKGALKWNYERMNELEVRLPDSDNHQEGFTLLRAGPQHPEFAHFYPGTGNSMSYEDLKLIETHQFLQSIAEDRQHKPSFADALAVAEVHAAMARSWESRQWEEVTAL